MLGINRLDCHWSIFSTASAVEYDKLTVAYVQRDRLPSPYAQSARDLQIISMQTLPHKYNYLLYRRYRCVLELWFHNYPLERWCTLALETNSLALFISVSTSVAKMVKVAALTKLTDRRDAGPGRGDTIHPECNTPSAAEGVVWFTRLKLPHLHASSTLRWNPIISWQWCMKYSSTYSQVII